MHQGILQLKIDDYIELYKKGGYIREMRKHVEHAPILTCACGVIIENDNGEILLQKRKDNGCWAIIGGSMEMGETFEETVRREIREEAGLSLERLDVFQLYSGKDCIMEYPKGDICFGPSIVFITNEYYGEIVNDPEEVMEHRFYKKTELSDNRNRYDKDIILEWAAREYNFAK
jgi:8-oxo-dGTP pyrophosphatase MutT (NUDIX family)